jgi:hypothetical protein
MQLDRVFAVFVLCLALAAACDPGSGPESLVLVPSVDRTSDLAPARQIGLDPDGIPLVSVRDVVVAADGSLYVLDSELRQVMRFGSDGELISSMGREGAGPGEFREASAFSVASDTVFVFDAWSGRIESFAADGSYLGTRSIERVPRLGRPPEIWRHRAGDWVYVDSRPPESGSLEGGQVLRERAALMRLPPHSDSWAEVGAFPGHEFAVLAPPGSRLVARDAPFGRGPLWAPSESGIAWYADSGAYRVLEIIDTGRSGRAITAEVEPLGVTREDEAAYLEADDWVEISGVRHSLQAERRQVPMPDRKPVLPGLLTDDQGNLWVGTYSANDSIHWHVYQPDGTPSFFVRLSATFDPKFVGEDGMVAVGRDSLGVQFVQEFVWSAPDYE